MSDWNKMIKEAEQKVEERSFVVASKRDLGNSTSLRVIGKVGKHQGRTLYKVIEETPNDNWY